VGDTGGKSKEEEVKSKAEDFLKRMPKYYIESEYRAKISEINMPEPYKSQSIKFDTIPINAFFL